jgi:xyloglucan-specific endo-beta-1,4-glucanase
MQWSLLETLTFAMQNLFFKYLVTNYANNGFTNSLYLQTMQAGTEVFTGSNAKLTTSAYSIAIT